MSYNDRIKELLEVALSSHGKTHVKILSLALGLGGCKLDTSSFLEASAIAKI